MDAGRPLAGGGGDRRRVVSPARRAQGRRDRDRARPAPRGLADGRRRPARSPTPRPCGHARRPRPAADQGPVVGVPRAPPSRRRDRSASSPTAAATRSDPDPQVHVVEVRSGRIRQRSKLPGEVMRFSFDPDGTPICIAFDRNPPMDEDPSLVWRVAGDGSGLLLTEGMESFAGKQGVGDERLTVIPDAGREVPCRVTDDGLVQLVDPALNPTAYELTGAGERVAALMSLNDYDGADVYALEPGREPRRRTAAGDAWLAGRARPVMQELIVKGPAGPIRTFVPVSGRRQEPADADHPAHSRRPHLGVAVCGRRHRPHAGWRWATGWRDRTSGARTDQGREWIAALDGAWGDADDADCHAVLDHLVKAGLADPKRLGCYGNSYGGFMVNWLVGTSRPVRRGGLVQRRHQPDLGLRELRRRLPLQPTGGPGRAAHARGCRVALAAVAAAERVERAHAADDPAGRERPALPAGRQRAVLHSTAPRWAERSSTCCTPTATTRWPRAHDPTAASTAWSGSWRGSGSICSRYRFCNDPSRICPQPSPRAEAVFDSNLCRFGSTGGSAVTPRVTGVKNRAGMPAAESCLTPCPLAEGRPMRAAAPTRARTP